MSGYPYGGSPQYPPPHGQIYPQVYGQVNAPPPGQPGLVLPGNPVPGQNPQYAYQPGYSYGQPPSAMSYPSVAPTAPPTAPGFNYGGFPTVTPTYAPAIEWIPSNLSEAPRLANQAVVAGYEGYDGSPLWVIRARFEGDLIPGKLAANHNAAYVPWGGKENAVHSFEVCCARPERIRWVESRDGSIPANAVVGGNTSSGEPLYVGRAKEQGSLTPGKVHPSHRAMYISFAGKEVAHKGYEILCTV